MTPGELDALLAGKRAADEALASAGETLTAEYEKARAAYEKTPNSDAKRGAYKAAGEQLAAYRQVQRENRDGVRVVGDAFRSSDGEASE